MLPRLVLLNGSNGDDDGAGFGRVLIFIGGVCIDGGGGGGDADAVCWYCCF